MPKPLPKRVRRPLQGPLETLESALYWHRKDCYNCGMQYGCGTAKGICEELIGLMDSAHFGREVIDEFYAIASRPEGEGTYL